MLPGAGRRVRHLLGIVQDASGTGDGQTMGFRAGQHDVRCLDGQQIKMRMPRRAIHQHIVRRPPFQHAAQRDRRCAVHNSRATGQHVKILDAIDLLGSRGNLAGQRGT
jgi:hypothetical protein